MLNSSKLRILFCLSFLLVATRGTQLITAAQTPEDVATRERTLQLYKQNKFTEAIPLLEKLTKVYPDDAVIWEQLGWATFVVSASIKDPTERTALRNRARTALLRAKELGDNSNLLRTGLDALAVPDTSANSFSTIKAADAAMREGEDAHIRGDLDKAIEGYQRALQLDPKLYLAALWIGDMYFKKAYNETNQRLREENLNKAGESFKRAIEIDENIETAYRYWGDALMLQGRQSDAMIRFIDAIVAEPGNRKAYMGLSQWGERNTVNMGHPRIEVPVKVSVSGEKKVNVELGNALSDSEEGAAWTTYGLVRSHWVAEDFAKTFPKETTYRHSLREEAAALKKTAEVANEMLKAGKIKSLSPSLAALVKLNEADLLEPFIFFARADEGIVRDYEDFRRSNREKLRRYWSEVVIAKR